MSVKHANCYDNDPWCEAANPWKNGDDVIGSGAPLDIDSLDEVTCDLCLQVIEAYGRRVAAIRHRRQGQRTGGKCFIPSHAADCDCEGAGGDR